MYYVGIDIGSTAAKVAMFKGEDLVSTFTMPTGWSSLETAKSIKDRIESEFDICSTDYKVVATGYGRVSVPYADKTVTEITCHGRGAAHLYDDNCTVIDIGGQDTKVITLENGMVTDFIMNDKCSAGTGRFMEIMANVLGISIDELCDLASKGGGVTISSMCTVFAESEVISLIGRGEKKEDIAFAVIDSIVSKVKSLCGRHSSGNKYFLTGGLCDCDYIVESLSKKLEKDIKTCKDARYAGAIGAALLAKKI
ncbi:CoA-substrate-specific enzyme activase, putative [Hathewaya proteolytica DSM 3090]|uniref:CoA-substrate-specific enzyme activase, putative n=1 Tax=Hathewaya proteolytica DSM 3090 TaxID=1121331 RepID=A0A1M6MBF5_9CLOT|nr:acyl-CoA dehydratase activase [Hathewaya proteolytica]SHJ80769.1 CoA-substrate-specific enzyme activase, putative [Hathewaya proteolytica DSM 3090]